MPYESPTKSTYVAAFLLGGLIALLFVPRARSAEPFRLDRVGVVRFTDAGDGKLRRQAGVLDLAGRVAWRPTFEVARPANTPAWALDRTLISVDAWLSYRALGFGAVDNFELTEGSVRFAIGDESYHFVAPSESVTFATGQMINISTRARVGAGANQVIAGFVIEDRPRFVLVRAVGPGLARFGVADAVSDPQLRVNRGTETIDLNDNWSMQHDTPAIRAAAARVGAFALEDGSRDAARLLLLAPGAYTVHVEPAAPDVGAGQVLVEVYSVPEDAFDSIAPKS